MTHLDPRLLVGLNIKIPDLVEVFVSHRPGECANCGACAHRYTVAEPLCPSAVLARDLLRRRESEDREATEPIRKELHRVRDNRPLPTAEPVPPDAWSDVDLFPVDPTWRRPRRTRTESTR